MQYNLSTAFDRERFKVRVNALYKKGCVVELTEKTFRTTNQNSYLHLLLGIVAMETGNTLEYVKQHYFKRLVNPGIFVYTRQDKFLGVIEEVRSSASLSKEEMMTAIDRLKIWGAENAIYLPDADNEEVLKQVAIEMDRNKAYL